MKISVTFKDPDAVYDQVHEAVVDSVRDLPLDDDEKDGLIETRVEKTNELLKRWITYGEYVTVEFDTDAGTAAVAETGDHPRAAGER